MKTENERKALKKVLAVSLLLVVLTVLLWGIQSNWGAVKISRFNIQGDNGTKISGISYVPKNASNEKPLPTVVIFHGRSNHAHSNDTWSMELARRGYVVFSPDLSGGGESDVNSREEQGASVLQYVGNLPFVDKANLNIVGYSAGCATTLYSQQKHPELVNGVVTVFGPFMVQMFTKNQPVNLDCNYGMIKAKADQYDYNFIGDPAANEKYITTTFGLPENVQYNKVYEYGNGNIFRYDMVNDALHQTGNISGQTISYIIEDIELFSEAPVKLASNDLMWLPQQAVSLACALCVIFFIAFMANLLMYNPFFAAIKAPVPQNKGLRGKKLTLRIFMDIAIPTVLFVPVSAYVMMWTAKSKIFTSTNLNGIMGWLVALGLISVVMLIIRFQKAKKEGTKIPFSDLALGAEGEEKFVWSRVIRSFIMGSLVVGIVLIWLGAIEGFAGVTYQFWNIATMLRVNHMRFLRAIPYICIIFFAMITGGMGMLVTRRLPETGNEKKDMVVAVIVNLVISAACLAILLILQYGGSLIIGTGQTIIPQMDLYGTGQNTSVGALDFAFGYCFMMGTMNAVITYLYRKSGTIWPGLAMCCMFAGFITTASFTLVR